MKKILAIAALAAPVMFSSTTHAAIAPDGLITLDAAGTGCIVNADANAEYAAGALTISSGDFNSSEMTHSILASDDAATFQRTVTLGFNSSETIPAACANQSVVVTITNTESDATNAVVTPTVPATETITLSALAAKTYTFGLDIDPDAPTGTDMVTDFSYDYQYTISVKPVLP